MSNNDPKPLEWNLGRIKELVDEAFQENDKGAITVSKWVFLPWFGLATILWIYVSVFVSVGVIASGIVFLAVKDVLAENEEGASAVEADPDYDPFSFVEEVDEAVPDWFESFVTELGLDREWAHEALNAVRDNESIFLGYYDGTHRPIRITLHDLVQGSLGVWGRRGANKTTTAVGILTQLFMIQKLRKDAGEKALVVLVFEPKGGERLLVDTTARTSRFFGLDYKLFSPAPSRPTYVCNLLQGLVSKSRFFQQTVEAIAAFAGLGSNDAYGEGYFTERSLAIIEAKLTKLLERGADSETITMSELAAAPMDGNPGGPRGDGFHAEKVLSKLGRLESASLKKEKAAELGVEEAHEHRIDFRSAFKQGGGVYHFFFEASGGPLAIKQLVSGYLASVLSTAQQLQDEGEETEVIILLEEMSVIAGGGGTSIKSIINLGRSANCAIIGMTQSLHDLKSNRGQDLSHIMDLIGYNMALKMSDEMREYVSRQSGTVEEQRQAFTVPETSRSDFDMGTTTVRYDTVEKPMLSENDLIRISASRNGFVIEGIEPTPICGEGMYSTTLEEYNRRKTTKDWPLRVDEPRAVVLDQNEAIVPRIHQNPAEDQQALEEMLTTVENIFNEYYVPADSLSARVRLN